ncbi:hypothetical protein [Methylocystis parvus]|uniref:hypothetical protein n=1 Tax=Methylocystis parvus TaxID=134 RepID=UPI003C70C1E1
MTPSVETAAPVKEPYLRFSGIVSVHDEDCEIVVVFRDAQGEATPVTFPKADVGFLLECFDRIYGTQS